MNTIVCNTLTGAVSEYDWPAFQSITPTHAGDAAGLFELVGDTDNGQPIVSTIGLPPTLRESTLKHYLRMAYFSMLGSGEAEFTVLGRPSSWTYTFGLRASGQTRCEVGRGIRENYLGFEIKTRGQAFSLDRIEIMDVESKTRRV